MRVASTPESDPDPPLSEEPVESGMDGAVRAAPAAFVPEAEKDERAAELTAAAWEAGQTVCRIELV